TVEAVTQLPLAPVCDSTSDVIVPPVGLPLAFSYGLKTATATELLGPAASRPARPSVLVPSSLVIVTVPSVSTRSHVAPPLALRKTPLEAAVSAVIAT